MFGLAAYRTSTNIRQMKEAPNQTGGRKQPLCVCPWSVSFDDHLTGSSAVFQAWARAAFAV
jgi:hypothetical protein